MSPTPSVRAASTWSARIGRNVTFTFSLPVFSFWLANFWNSSSASYITPLGMPFVVEEADGVEQDQCPDVAALRHLIEIAGATPESLGQRDVARRRGRFVGRRYWLSRRPPAAVPAPFWPGARLPSCHRQSAEKERARIIRTRELDGTKSRLWTLILSFTQRSEGARA